MEKIREHAVIITVIALLMLGILAILLFRLSLKKPVNAPTPTSTFHYIEIHDACGWTWVGSCVNMRSGAGTSFPVVLRLRDGIVLQVGSTVVVDGLTWYKIIFTTELHYPERVKGDLYVAATDSVRYFADIGDQTVPHVSATSTQRIIVDVSEQMLYAYDGASLYMKEPISTGLALTPTQRGTFYILKKTPSRYMQGPTPGTDDQYFDLPGVPWDLYFTNDGSVIHGAYWHNKFGQPWSHGCVNLPPDKAKKLYEWAYVGTPILIQN